MSISSLVVELWQFPFIRDYQKSGQGKDPVLVFPNICRLGQVRDTKFCRGISNTLLLNAVKCQAYSFSRFWVIKGKPTRGGEGSIIKLFTPEVCLFFSKESLFLNVLSCLFIVMKKYFTHRYFTCLKWNLPHIFYVKTNRQNFKSSFIGVPFTK